MITIIDYNAGNLTSVKLAFQHINQKVTITNCPEKILSAERIVFPGVGAARSAMENLENLKLIDSIKKVISQGVPFLGICIGMQLLFDESEEDNNTPCLAVMPGKVKKFQPTDPSFKIPQMGWNTLSFKKNHPIFHGIEDKSEFYFVHSYYPQPAKDQLIIGQTDYAQTVFASSAAINNVAATQFHPERSGRIGLKLLENFSKWNGKC